MSCLANRSVVKFVIEENKLLNRPSTASANAYSCSGRSGTQHAESKIYIRYFCHSTGNHSAHAAGGRRSARQSIQSSVSLWRGRSRQNSLDACDRTLRPGACRAAKLLSLSSEKFTNEFINSIRDNRGEASVTNTVVSIVCSLMIFRSWLEKNRLKRNFSIRLMRCMRNGNRSSSPATDRRRKFRPWKNGFVPVLNGG